MRTYFTFQQGIVIICMYKEEGMTLTVILILLLSPLTLIHSRRSSETFYSSPFASSSSSLSSTIPCITTCCVNCKPDNCEDCYKVNLGCQCLNRYLQRNSVIGDVGSLMDRLRGGHPRKTGAGDKEAGKLVSNNSITA